MSKYLSRKIKFISLFAMIAVVYIHSYNFTDNYLTPTTRISEGFSFSAMFEYFFSNGICQFAVPLFFIISGFLFYYTYKNTLDGYKTKLSSRIYSLVVPYILWCFISALFVLCLNFSDVTSELDIVKQFPVEKTTDFLKCLINPPAFQLWFLQQLIIFAIISPVIYLLIKYTKGLILIPFAGLWLFDISFIINSQALFFFSLGATVAISGSSRKLARQPKTVACLLAALLWITLSLALTFMAALTPKDSAFCSVIMTIISKANQAVGVVAMWLLFDHIVKFVIRKKYLLLIRAHLFFIFAMHEPLLHVCYQLALSDINSKFGNLILYIGLPISVTALCVIVSMIIRKIARPLHRVLTGGRD